jgi:phosphopantothenoylcysteine decarboxylase/phosphopantothenate--cysteine ligase
MNARMWEHPATQANVDLLVARGVELVGPAAGELAEGEIGVGRMAEPEEIAARVEAILGAGGGALRGRRVVVSAGGTREPLDAVRYLGNRSSGRMGVALAREARRRGAEVTLLAANLAVPAPPGIEVVETPTAADLERAALERAGADVIVMAAAVADYRPAEARADKRPKDGAPWMLELLPTADVLGTLGASRREGQVLVGFAAEGAGPDLERARRKLLAKSVDLVVFNDVSRDDVGFDVPDNEVVLVSAAGEKEVPKAPKERIAAIVLDEVQRLLSEG